MEEAWGRPASQVFASISPAPIAAASLGQARDPHPLQRRR